MDLNPVSLWQSLQFLPETFAIAVFALICTIVCALFIFPTILMLISEPKQLSNWWRGRREATAEGETHTLKTVVNTLDGINNFCGSFIAWLSLFMVLVQFIVVLMRYVFAYGSIQMQESIWYMHGILFMIAAGYTLMRDGHVRVDIIYRDAKPKTKAWINLLGTLLFLIPICLVTWSLSWSYVSNAWAVMEGSTEGSGLPYIYLFKTVILVFAGLMILQALSLIARSILIIKGHDTSAITEAGVDH